MILLKRFLFENKKEIIAFAVLIAITVLLCVPFTMKYAVGVFGYAVYFYLAVTYVIAILHCKKKKVNFTKGSKILLLVSTVCLLATLHVACVDKQYTLSFTDYIISAYETGTAGGVIFAVATSPIVVLCTKVWSIVIFMVATVVMSFFFIRPFVFEGLKTPMEIGKRKHKIDKDVVCHEIILDDSPFMHKRAPSPKPVPFLVEDSADETDEARRMLFGGFGEEEEETSGFSLVSLSGDTSYDVRKTDISEPLRVKVVQTEEEVNAAKTLFGEDEEEQTAGLNYGDEEELEEVIFDNETDDKIFDILQPKTVESPFLQGLKQRLGQDTYAPAPIRYDIRTTVEEVEEEEEYEEYEEYEEETLVAPENARVESTRVVQEAPAPVKPAPVVRTPAPTPAPTHATLNTEGVTAEPQSASTFKPIVQRVEKPKLPYNKPPISMLKTHFSPDFNPQVDNWDELKDVFEVKLANYNVEAKLVDAIKGPTLTLCVLELGDRCPINRLQNVKTDLQRWLKSKYPVTIVTQITGTNYCGVQIPNAVQGIVGFKEIISSKEYREAKGDILIALGKSAEGDVIVEDLAAMPHALVAGTTGSGKSVCLNVVLASILFRYTPDEVKLLLIDLKEVEMALYSKLPHMLLKEPLSSIPAIINALKWVKDEVVKRFSMFKELHVRNLAEYNKLEGVEKLPRIVIIIDEASELMSDNTARKAVESTLSSLARIARAAGAHLIFATQNPVKTVITNEIQNNLNTKIAFAVGDYNHSMVIFKAKGAENLIGKGDMYIKRGTDMRRAQCAFVSTEEIEEAVDYIKENNDVDFDEDMIEKILNGNMNEQKNPSPANTSVAVANNNNASDNASEGEDDPNAPDINWRALKICVDENYVSCSFLQRKLRKGYNTIANILEELAADGYITSVPQGSKEKREILISKEEFYREWEQRFGADETHSLENFDDSI